MTSSEADLAFRFEWEPTPHVRAPELQATWARLEIWAGDTCVSHVEDVETGSARRSVYGAVYPLAEWVAFNWWFLRVHSRASLAGHRTGHRGGASRHNLRAAGDGQAWPDLSIVPQGRTTRLTWRADRRPAIGAPVRFIADGELDIPSEQAQHALRTLVQSVLTRLQEHAIHDTPLAKEWQAIVEADPDEAAFCVAAARLGIDPYTTSPEESAQIIHVGERLEEPLLGDFLDAIDPARITDSLRWVERVTKRIRRSAAPTQTIPQLPRLHDGIGEGVSSTRPWEAGYRQAQALREQLGMPVTEAFDPGAFLGVGQTAADPTITGLGGWVSGRSGLVILGERLPSSSQRFAEARALWHFLYEPDQPRFLIVGSVTDRHRTERAFAAELLAPADGIAGMLGDRHAADRVGVDEAQLTRVAQHFGASPWVVRHQVENQLDIPALEL